MSCGIVYVQREGRLCLTNKSSLRAGHASDEENALAKYGN